MYTFACSLSLSLTHICMHAYTHIHMNVNTHTPTHTFTDSEKTFQTHLKLDWIFLCTTTNAKEQISHTIYTLSLQLYKLCRQINLLKNWWGRKKSRSMKQPRTRIQYEMTVELEIRNQSNVIQHVPKWGPVHIPVQWNWISEWETAICPWTPSVSAAAAVYHSLYLAVTGHSL